MFELLRTWVLWFLMLISSQPQKHLEVQDAQSDATYYVGVVAAEAAYTTLLPNTPDKPKPAPSPVDPANCPTCKGVGKVPSGDGQGWTKCPTCKGGKTQSTNTTAITGTSASSQGALQSPPAPPSSEAAPGQTFRRR